jgi:hypothetical protein
MWSIPNVNEMLSSRNNMALHFFQMKFGKLSDEYSQPQPLLPLDQLLLQKEEDNESEFV